MDFTLAICTYNRADILCRTFDSLGRLDVPRGVSHEVLVVDNGSTDGTGAVCSDAIQRGLPVRIVREPVVGICNARNRAMLEAAGSRYLIFLDDDVNVPPDLVAAYSKACESRPDLPYRGGPIVPVFDCAHTSLSLAILERRPAVYGGLDLGPQPMELHPSAGPWGGNCCITMASVGPARFDNAGGRHGDRGPGGEEPDFVYRLFRQHGPGRWEPTAKVEHRIPAFKMTWRYLKTSARRAGRGVLRVAVAHEGEPMPTTRSAIWFWRRFLAFRLSEATARHAIPLPDLVDRRYRVWYQLGVAEEAWRIARGSSGAPAVT